MTESRSKREQIKAVAEPYPVANLRIFDTGCPDELGIIVDALPEAVLFDLGGLQEALETLVGGRVRLATPAELPRRVRDSVIASAESLS